MDASVLGWSCVCFELQRAAFYRQMAIQPIHLPVLAREKEDENWRFRQFLKLRCKLHSTQLDQHVFDLTRRIWAEIDCTTCANCCKTVRPTLSNEDVRRLSQRLAIDPEQLIDTYLEPNEHGADNPWRTRTMPCPFLKDNHCTVYEDRPADCHGYPYLDERDFAFRTIAMIERTFTCPIVYEVMEALKQEVGFRRRGRK
jgi:uncharacterized protein